MRVFAPLFDADKILSYNTGPTWAGTGQDLANKIHECIQNEQFCWFETQELENHDHAKVNLGLWKKHVDLFNQTPGCIRGVEMMMQSFDKTDQTWKMLPVELKDGGGIDIVDMGDPVASETSHPRFMAEQEQASDKKVAEEDSEVDEEFAPATGAAAAVPGPVVRDAEPEEKSSGFFCCATKKSKGQKK